MHSGREVDAFRVLARAESALAESGLAHQTGSSPRTRTNGSAYSHPQLDPWNAAAARIAR